MTCCDKLVKSKQLQNGNLGVWCSVCGKKAEGKTQKEAYDKFKKLNPTNKTKITKKDLNSEEQYPSNPNQLPVYYANNIKDVQSKAAPFIAKEMPALQRMIKKNIRYVMGLKDKKMMKVWSTKEGQESIIFALTEAFELGASLPEMGSIVPFGTVAGAVAEFIPAVEAFNFALTTGSNAPFEWIQIECIYKNDIRKINRKKGVFEIDLEMGSPRGDLLQIAVYGFNKHFNHIIGELYDTPRLMEKAKRHSKSYQWYLKEKNDLAKAQSEGKNFIIDKWNNKKYESDITNPYAGPDQPEMLRKFAGKSFLRPFVKVRNSEAAIEELKNSNDNVDDLIENAFKKADQVIPGPEKSENIEKEEVKEEDMQIVDDKEPVKKQEDKKEEKSDNKDLFGNKNSMI